LELDCKNSSYRINAVYDPTTDGTAEENYNFSENQGWYEMSSENKFDLSSFCTMKH
jgi:hypothetical protein